MTQPLDIAVVGATGSVGETLVQILEELQFPVATLHLLASMESAGSSVMFAGKKIKVREVDSFDFAQVKLAFFAASPAVSRSFADKAAQAGCTVIDLSGGLDDAVAVVPEANADCLANLELPARLSQLGSQCQLGLQGFSWRGRGEKSRLKSSPHSPTARTRDSPSNWRSCRSLSAFQALASWGCTPAVANRCWPSASS